MTTVVGTVVVTITVILTTITTTSWSGSGGGNVVVIASSPSVVSGPARRRVLFSQELALKESSDAHDDNDEEEEFVTPFYKRVQEKQRALINGPAGGESDGGSRAGLFGNNASACRKRAHRDAAIVVDHSLDHYFHHHQPSTHLKAIESSSSSSSSSSWSMRGGGESLMLASQTPSDVDDDEEDVRTHRDYRRKSKTHHGWRSRHPAYHQRQNQHHHHSHEDKLMMESPSPSGMIHSPTSRSLLLEEDTVYSGGEEEEDIDDTGEDMDDEHCPGLLRVPCSITINSDEEDDAFSLFHPHDHHHYRSLHKTTPVAAFVDTGAQVTVISASAARRAGIYHLMDRRYAGRATGVGHCRVLGRIPARHVYFLLGGREGECYGQDDLLDQRRHHHHHAQEQGETFDRRIHLASISDENEDMNDDQGNIGIVQMDGPALTVIEGTVTKGVDVLLGLDVLQDWEAEIRMGPTTKSITVKKKKKRRRHNTVHSSFRGGTSIVEIPFVTRNNFASSSRMTPKNGGVDNKINDRSSNAFRSYVAVHPTIAHKDSSSGQHNDYSFLSNLKATSSNRRCNSSAETVSQHRNHHSAAYHERQSASVLLDENEVDVDDDFYPMASDIESDLDLLDQTGHEFPENRIIGSKNKLFGNYRKGNNDYPFTGEAEEYSQFRHYQDFSHGGVSDGLAEMGNHEDFEDEDYLQDDIDDDNTIDRYEEIDMSGL